MIPLSLYCDRCHALNEREVQEYKPEDFSKEGTKSVLSQYWCCKCGEVQVIRYEFYRDNQKKIRARLKCQIEASSSLVSKQPTGGITARAKASKHGNR